jgi:ribonucleoside-diphosphate reductase alpha chain
MFDPTEGLLEIAEVNGAVEIGSSVVAPRRSVQPERRYGFIPREKFDNINTGNGLRIQRFFTQPGVDPFDTVEWERRTAVIAGERGEVVFEQKDVEVPAFWSQLATNVVASKYFRGQIGTPEREHSVRQVIGRVVETLTRWGREMGYFASEQDAEAFRDELKHLLLYQHASFNSPVWFNIGIEPRPQSSACFIVSVEDTMESILELAKTEGMIFKFGSGSGSNLSRIRGSKEYLSGGGRASGPVSFMRGFDAFAGVIKSGGKTRRAAKMVVLNIDHPDIVDFIECKAKEEKKAWALIEAGYDPGFDTPGGAYDSVFFQNANHSVRVTDEFMRAVEQDGEWCTYARTTSEVMGRYRARELFRKIAEAAWICGDPGLQFHDTTNKWHTVKNSGPIEASNPCSEFVFLNDTSCNLASLNLMKFRLPDGRFDVEAFRAAVRILLTAQEIIVDNSAYPTERICDNSHNFRPLGLGYANLGALLMSLGLPYDSDAGRAYAAVITAIMHGEAYRQSAIIARDCGAPFPGFALNREPMLEVMRMHADALNQIQSEYVPDYLLQTAREIYQEMLQLGEQYGYRNAQVTVLAPTGCLVGHSLVATEYGLVRLRTLGNPAGEQWQDVDFMVATDEGTHKATKFYINGVAPTRIIRTRSGYTIQGTPNHQIKVIDAATGERVWRRLDAIRPGDIVPLHLNSLFGEPKQVPLPPLGDLHWNADPTTRVPRYVTPELAELVGYYMGDGSLHAKGVRFCISAQDTDVAERIQHLCHTLFGIEPQIAKGTRGDYLEIFVHSVPLAIWWEACGFTKHKPHDAHQGKGFTPHIPDAILWTNDPLIYCAFLRGLFEADGSVIAGVPSLTTTSETFANEVRSLLLALGYPTKTKVDRSAWGQGTLYVLRLRNRSYNEAFMREIGFLGQRKRGAVVCGTSKMPGKGDRIYLPLSLVRELVPPTSKHYGAISLALKRHGAIPRERVLQLLHETGDRRLAELLQFYYDSVVANEDGGLQPTYDLSVPANLTYIANGFVSHNTISFMMDCDTTGIEPDIALVKYKTLVGGGMLKIVNTTVPLALQQLGYSPEQIEAITRYIDEHDTIEGAPYLKEEHLPVFDCAFRPAKGTRSLAPMAHVKMMAAVQPFLSGAISKCVTGDTLLFTDRGILPIEQLYQGEKPDTFRPCSLKVASIDAPQEADLFYYGGLRPTIRLILQDGRIIEGTPNHRIKVANRHGYGWKRLDEVEPGDFVAIRLGAEMWSSQNARFDDFQPSPLYGGQKAIRIPRQMTPDLARLLGYYIAEGNMTRSNWTVRITNNNLSVLQRCQRLLRDLFGLESQIVTDARNGVTSVVVASKALVEFLEYLGCGEKASEKQIPWAVLQSRREVVQAFVGALWLDGYIRRDGMVAICLASEKLLRQLQVVLNNFGIRANLIRKYAKTTDRFYTELTLFGENVVRFAALFDLDEAHKRERLAESVQYANRGAGHSDVVPCLREQIQDTIRAAKLTYQWRQVLDPRTQYLSWNTVARFHQQYPLNELSEIVDNDIHFVPVVEIESRFAPVYDLQVPGNHAFLGNCVINHNTVNMPNDATPEDIEQIYMQAWKMGLKAIAIYRDGSKRTQPLSTKKPSEQEAQLPVPTERPIRRHLPDERRSITHKFSIAGHEGYITVGMYEDGTPGEIFITMAKEGSVISGLMDAFATAISLALQYGVPLEKLVEKFSYTRFQPSGFTNNPQIPVATSIVDYIFRWLGMKFLNQQPPQKQALETLEEQPAPPVASTTAQPETMGITGAKEETPPSLTPTGQGETMDWSQLVKLQQDAPPCPVCGMIMVRAGACHQCLNCGTSYGCS